MEKPAPDEIERLILELKDDRRDVRSRAAYELGKHDDPRTIPPLISALSDPDKFVRSWAAGALGKAGPTAAAPLMQVIEGADSVTGYYAALALGELGDLHAVPTLVKAVREGDYDIRPSAAGLLAKFGDAGTLPDRILSDASLSAEYRVDLLNSVRGLVYSDEEVQLDYTLPDVKDLCADRLHAADESVKIGAELTLRALNPAVPASSQEPVPVTESPGPSTEPPASPAEGASTTAASTNTPPDAPAARTTLDTPPTQREHEKPKRGFWSKLLGRPDSGKRP